MITIVGLLMALGFGALTYKNFSSGRLFRGALTSLGMLLGLASLWVDYQRANDAPAQQQAQTANSPWAKDA